MAIPLKPIKISTTYSAPTSTTYVLPPQTRDLSAEVRQKAINDERRRQEIIASRGVVKPDKRTDYQKRIDTSRTQFDEATKNGILTPFWFLTNENLNPITTGNWKQKEFAIKNANAAKTAAGYAGIEATATNLLGSIPTKVPMNSKTFWRRHYNAYRNVDANFTKWQKQAINIENTPVIYQRTSVSPNSWNRIYQIQDPFKKMVHIEQAINYNAKPTSYVGRLGRNHWRAQDAWKNAEIYYDRLHHLNELNNKYVGTSQLIRKNLKTAGLVVPTFLGGSYGVYGAIGSELGWDVNPLDEHNKYIVPASTTAVAAPDIYTPEEREQSGKF